MTEKKYSIVSDRYPTQKIIIHIKATEYTDSDNVFGQYWFILEDIVYSSQKYICPSEKLLVNEMMKDASEYIQTKYFVDRSLPQKLTRHWLNQQEI